MVAIVVGIGSLWCCRPWLTPTAFAYGQLVALMLSWKVASLLCLPSGEWARFTPLRFLAYCLFPGMQPRQFLRGQRLAPGAPMPTVTAVLVNAAAGAALLWLAQHLLPAATPLAVRFWVALVGITLLAPTACVKCLIMQRHLPAVRKESYSLARVQGVRQSK